MDVYIRHPYIYYLKNVKLDKSDIIVYNRFVKFFLVGFLVIEDI